MKAGLLKRSDFPFGRKVGLGAPEAPFQIQDCGSGSSLPAETINPRGQEPCLDH